MTPPVYKPLPHPFDQYDIGSDGSLRSRRVRPEGRLKRVHCGTDGYVRCSLLPRTSDAEPQRTKATTFYVHRLVAAAHVPNPEGFTDVDHVNGQKADNRAENLRWCSHAQNLQWARSRLGNWSKGMNGKPVIATPCDGRGPAQEWPSVRSWAIASGNYRRGANVSVALKTGRPAYGFYWQLKNPKAPTQNAPQSL
jgi:hypothetical protein